MFTHGWCSRMFTHTFSCPSSYQFCRLHLCTVALSLVIFSHLSAPALVQSAVVSLIVLTIPIKFLCHKFCSFPPIFHTLVRWTFKIKKIYILFCYILYLKMSWLLIEFLWIPQIGYVFSHVQVFACVVSFAGNVHLGQKLCTLYIVKIPMLQSSGVVEQARVGQSMTSQETVQELTFQTLSVYFIIYFMLGLACLVVPGGEFLKGTYHVRLLCSFLDRTVYGSCQK